MQGIKIENFIGVFTNLSGNILRMKLLPFEVFSTSRGNRMKCLVLL